MPPSGRDSNPRMILSAFSSNNLISTDRHLFINSVCCERTKTNNSGDAYWPSRRCSSGLAWGVNSSGWRVQLHTLSREWSKILQGPSTNWNLRSSTNREGCHANGGESDGSQTRQIRSRSSRLSCGRSAGKNISLHFRKEI